MKSNMLLSSIDSTRNNINYKSKITDNNLKSEQEKKTNDKFYKYSSLALLGLLGISTAIMYDRTSKIRIKKIISGNKSRISFADGDVVLDIKNFKDKTNVKTIEELSGLTELKEFIQKYSTILKNDKTASEHKLKRGFSMLLWGTPGTGKTSAAKGIAKYLNADYIKLDKELFDSEFVSVGPRILANYMNALVEHANNNKQKPLVIFMDEIDGVISVDKGSASRHSEDMLNIMKQSMIKLQDECDNVIFIGATNKDPNRIKSDNKTIDLNSAILSRFKYQFELKLPSKEDIVDCWKKLSVTNSGKHKFNDSQNKIISESFEKLGLSYRDIEYINEKLNFEDAYEFCKTKSYNSSNNLVKILSNDEKIGYDYINQKSMPKAEKEEIIKTLESSVANNANVFKNP